MSVRLTRPEKKERTRADLLGAARTVFLRRGFHGASLDEIAEEAGYTKGAVYSNFADKDALYLAVVDAHYEGRIESYAEIMQREPQSIEDAYRIVSRFMVEADTREPNWLPTLAEFVAHAAQDDDLRRAYAHTRARFLAAVADIIDELATRFGVSLRVSAMEAARASSVLARGYSAERRIDQDAVTPDVFVEVHTAFMRGLTVQKGEECLTVQKGEE